MSTLKTNNIQHVDRSDPSIIINTDGSVNIAGTMTYEDVTNVDAVGIITGRSLINAQKQVHVGTGVSVKAGGLNVTAGITTVQALQATTGTFSGDVDIADKIVHTGDTTTAIRFPTARTVTVETDGSERARIDSSGRVRIGCTAQPSTTVSGAQFDAGGKTLRISEGGGTSSTTGCSVQITGGGSNTSIGAAAAMGAVLSLTNCNNTDNNQTSVDFSASSGLSIAKVIGKNDSHSSRNGSLIFATSSAAAPAERARIDSSGRLLLGTTTEGHSNGDDLTIATSEGTGITLRSGTSHTGSIFFSDGTSGDSEYAGLVQYDHGSNFMRFYANSGEKARITSGGNLMLGTTTAAISGGIGMLIANSGGARIKLCDSDLGVTASDGFEIISGSDGVAYVYNRENTDLIFGTNNAERLRIHSGGAVTIGTATGNSSDRFTIVDPGNAFMSIRSDAQADGNNQILDFAVGTGNRASGNLTASIAAEIPTGATAGGTLKGLLKFSTNSGDSLSERMRIDTVGRLMLGTTTEGLGTYGEDLTIGSADHAGITIRTGNGHKGTIYFSDGTSGTDEYRGRCSI